MNPRAARAVQVERRGAAILALCRKIEGPSPSESTFMIVECGMHSGFPPCCIEFFVTTYRPLMELAASLNAHGETFAELVERASPKQAAALGAIEHHQMMVRQSGITPGYIPCPACLFSRRVVRVKRCDWHLTARQRRRILAESS